MVQHLTPNNAINVKKNAHEHYSQYNVVQTFNKWCRLLSSEKCRRGVNASNAELNNKISNFEVNSHLR